jgi:hypothetical protein
MLKVRFAERGKPFLEKRKISTEENTTWNKGLT